LNQIMKEIKFVWENTKNGLKALMEFIFSFNLFY